MKNCITKLPKGVNIAANLSVRVLTVVFGMHKNNLLGGKDEKRGAGSSLRNLTNLVQTVSYMSHYCY